MRKGMTLIEVLIGIAIVSIVGVVAYRAYAILIDTFTATRVRAAMAAVANERMELVRNMPYEQVGTIGGVPAGVIPPTQSVNRDGFAFTVETTVRNVDDPFDGTIAGTPNDLSPADYKLVEHTITCASCPTGERMVFTGRAAPRALETASQNGALFVEVIDASGLPIQGATVQVENSAVSPAISITDVTNSQGMLQIVDAPPAVQAYEITVSKAGYSTERTYAPAPNFNPVLPHATVALQTVTEITFAIDRVGQVDFSSVRETCAAVGGANLTLSGAKLIATNPDVPKYSQSHALGPGGALTVSGLEWDAYRTTFAAAGEDLRGAIPSPPLILAPNGTLSMRAVFEPASPLSLLVIVADAATQLPLADAAVSVAGASYSGSRTTGRGFLRQTDWSGGSGQELMVDSTRYAEDDGGVDALVVPGEVRLREIATSTHAAAGMLTSSTLDTGSASSFFTLSLSPQTQPPEAGVDSVKLQVSTATTSSPASWSYVGPDGTAGAYFTPANGALGAIHTGDRYLRYRAYLSTASTAFTPALADVAITFSSQCVPPGQVLFQGLPGDTYAISVTHAGYPPASDTAVVNSAWQEKVIYLNP